MRSNLMGKLWKSTILIKAYIKTEDIRTLRYSENSNRDKFFEIAEIINYYFNFFCIKIKSFT